MAAVVSLRSAARSCGSAFTAAGPSLAKRSLASALPRLSEHLFVHRDTDYNHAGLPFALSQENMTMAKEIVSRYPPQVSCSPASLTGGFARAVAQYKKGAVIPLLELCQRQNKNWTSISVMNYVAKLLEMPPMRGLRGCYLLHHVQPVSRLVRAPSILGGIIRGLPRAALPALRLLWPFFCLEQTVR